MAYRKMDRPTFGGSLRLGASPLSLYSEQKSLRFDAVTCHHWFKKDISDANDGMPRRKKVHTTISFLRRPKYAFVDPF